ncbi:acetate--CoA ligase family protein [Seohaeicola zhoushanensis]|uniref:Acyl-CoA synthetase n=1 Tax=Seohaeicola zhoushanensis TaxID=1569283 RepID=A0A8J3H1T0_9RHOB|nr:acetate--CoA ligase family protein [Seohaeicola zhoushanensis]GHF65733.1 acyl-CoA synthetase [Seohaeicola zhoushanensis]
MTRDLSRLFKPRTIAVIGGGAWCAAIVGAAERIGYGGLIVPVHPEGKLIAGRRALRSLAQVEGPVDAAFVGVNRQATIDVVAELAAMGAGGAVCFASGFTEAAAEDAAGGDLQARLVAAAGNMPLLGPNCYGFVNALDQAAIWPDQHGMRPVERGVAILTQSSNIAINLTMQRRALPIAMMVACGNMAQTTQAEIAAALLDDDRITAIGLHVEGFGNLRGWEMLASKARARGVALVALKVGASEQAQAAAVSHTASLAGGDAGAQALLDRLGIARLHTLPAFLETLKLLHCCGRLASRGVASISCSGGEASLVADLARGTGLHFPPLDQAQKQALRGALGPMVALANPLDYHTYIWRDTAAMTRAWAAMTGAGIGITLSLVDYPHTDATDWDCATQAALNVRAETGAPFAVVSTLPELMPEAVAARLMAGGVAPLQGLPEALAALVAASTPLPPPAPPLLLPGPAREAVLIGEAEAKAALAGFGLAVPTGWLAQAGDLEQAARGLTPPLVLKGTGLAHKSDHGAVRLGLRPGDLEQAAAEIGPGPYLLEEMVTDGAAELLVGVLRDQAHGFVLTLGAGGVLTELMQDSLSLLVPAPRDAVQAALMHLRCAPLLTGYRGGPAADIDAILAAIDFVQAYVTAHAATLEEIEINPLICTPSRAVAADALIREAQP